MDLDEFPAPLAELTTLRVGGPATRLVRAQSADELAGTLLDVWADRDEWLVLGGGSNVLVADEGFDGTVVRVESRGVTELPGTDDRIRLRVEAGHPWDDFVAETVDRGLAGVEALSGIPGSTGAAPIQNIGAYGQEVAGTLEAIEFLDFITGERERIPAAGLELGYRTSVIKQGRAGAVLAAEFSFPGPRTSGQGEPVRYAQLAGALGVDLGEPAPLAEVREAVLGLRRSKGMVLDPGDSDSVSAGSFFTNPIVSERFARTLPDDAPRWPLLPERHPIVLPLDGDILPGRPPEGPPQEYKLSAAWLIEHSGVGRGFALPGSRAGVSSKHTLALTNRGGASADEIASLARYIRAMVQSEFGILLQPEPVFVGVRL